MVALHILGDVLIIDPAPTMTHDLMLGRDHRVGHLLIAFECHDNREDADFDTTLLEHAQKAPDASTAAIFEGRFREQAPDTRHFRKPSIGQHGFRRGIAMKNVQFAAGLVVEGDLQRETGASGPLGVGKIGAVANQIAGIGQGIVRHSRPPVSGWSPGSRSRLQFPQGPTRPPHPAGPRRRARLVGAVAAPRLIRRRAQS